MRFCAEQQQAIRTAAPPLTVWRGSDSIVPVKWLALGLVVILLSSCNTMVTRRDLYSPEPGQDSYEWRKYMAHRGGAQLPMTASAATTTTTTTTTTVTEPQ